MNFGDHEGLHFDGLSKEEKIKFSSKDFQAKNGENWTDVKKRMNLFFGTLNPGNHLLFTHGGSIVSILNDYGVEKIPNNGSFFGLTLN